MMHFLQISPLFFPALLVLYSYVLYNCCGSICLPLWGPLDLRSRGAPGSSLCPRSSPKLGTRWYSASEGDALSCACPTSHLLSYFSYQRMGEVTEEERELTFWCASLVGKTLYLLDALFPLTPCWGEGTCDR